MSIHVTRAPTVPLTSYDTKRSSHLNNLQVDNCLIEIGQDLGSNTFLYFNFWLQMPDRNRVGPGSRCTFILTICKSTTAL